MEEPSDYGKHAQTLLLTLQEVVSKQNSHTVCLEEQVSSLLTEVEALKSKHVYMEERIKQLEKELR